jgi:hypothetical protein
VDHHLRRSRRADRHPRGLRLTDLPLWQQIDAAHLPDMTLAVLSSLPGAGLYSGGLTAVPARAPQARPRPRYQRPGPARLGTSDGSLLRNVRSVAPQPAQATTGTASPSTSSRTAAVRLAALPIHPAEEASGAHGVVLQGTCQGRRRGATSATWWSPR